MTYLFFQVISRILVKGFAFLLLHKNSLSSQTLNKVVIKTILTALGYTSS